jgi:cytochrome P450
MSLDTVAELYSPEFFEDPYPTFDALRGSAPLCWSSRHRAFVVTTYAECLEILTDDQRFADLSEDGSTVDASDTVEHVQCRMTISRALGPTVINDLDGKIRHIVDDLIDSVIPNHQTEFMRTIADPLSTRVLAEILGVPETDHDLFSEWAMAYSAALGDSAPEVHARYHHAATEVLAYFASKLVLPSSSAGLVASLATTSLGTARILLLCQQLMTAGRDLTTGLLGNAVHALLSHPRQLALLRDDPGLLDGAIEESLRWDAPVLGQARVSRVDTRVSGCPITRGATLLVMLGAANRDPCVFDQPQHFEITRANAVRHLAFGRGIHSCLGGPIARLEARITLRALLQRCADLRLAEQRPRRRSPGRMLNLMSFSDLPIQWS